MKNLTFLFALLLLPLSTLAQKSFHDFTVLDINGNEYPLSQLEGKKVLVVNTASKCGLTPQYEDLQALYEEYGGEDFEILAFPSNDFANQEPLDNQGIQEFCSSEFAVTFPLMSKISVKKGEEQARIYHWLTSASENGVEDSKVSWNFQKYLIDESGMLVGHVAPQKKPHTKKILSWLEGEEL